MSLDFIIVSIYLKKIISGSCRYCVYSNRYHCTVILQPACPSLQLVKQWNVKWKIFLLKNTFCV